MVGSRGRGLIEERGLTPAWTTEMATQAGAVSDTARRIADELYRRFERGSLAAVEILYFQAMMAAGARSIDSRCCRSTSADFGGLARPCLHSPTWRRVF